MRHLGIYISTFFAMVLMASCAQQEPETRDILSYVDPFIGTGGHGHTFPGATTPFGMVQLSPDTKLLGWDSSAGYHDSDSTIYGFSHTHLSGTGIGDLGDILILPYTGNDDPEQPIAIYDKRKPKRFTRLLSGFL